MAIIATEVRNHYYGPDSYGSVGYIYNIGKYEVTAGQYAAFLNAVAKADTYGLYNSKMWSDTWGCKIQQTGTSGSYIYSVAADWANRPVNYVSYWDACRFANWLGNGQRTGAQDASTTECGTYTLDGYTSTDGRAIQRSADWKWAVTSQESGIRQRIYKGGGTNAGYWLYPTQSDTAPSTICCQRTLETAPTTSQRLQYWSPYYRTNVGEFENSASAYGTFDQGGNVYEWNESIIYIGSYVSRGIRGCAFESVEQNMQHQPARTSTRRPRCASSGSECPKLPPFLSRHPLSPCLVGWQDCLALGDAGHRPLHIGLFTILPGVAQAMAGSPLCAACTMLRIRTNKSWRSFGSSDDSPSRCSLRAFVVNSLPATLNLQLRTFASHFWYNPSMRRIDRILARPINLPLREPFETAQRRAVSSPTVIVELHAGDIVGLGEATPVRYVTGEDAKTVVVDIATANEALEGARLSEFRLSAGKLTEALPYGKSARAGVEMALYDAVCKDLGIPLYAYLGGAPCVSRPISRSRWSRPIARKREPPKWPRTVSSASRSRWARMSTKTPAAWSRSAKARRAASSYSTPIRASPRPGRAVRA